MTIERPRPERVGLRPVRHQYLSRLERIGNTREDKVTAYIPPHDNGRFEGGDVCVLIIRN